MQVTVTSADGLKRELRVQVPAKDLAAKADQRLDELKNTVQLKGFRPGKVPVAHLKKTFGKQVMSEVIQQAVGESSQQALEQETLRPALQPDIDLEGEIDQVIEGNADLTYKMTFEIMPSFELSDFSKISVERPVAETTEADIDEAVKRLADNQKNYESKGEEPAEEGDLLTIDFIGRIGDEAFEGGTAEDATVEIGSGRFIPGFEEQLKGAKAGESRDLHVTFPEDYGAKELAGKEAVFETKVKEVKKPVPVTIDDEFAKRFGLDSLEKLREILGNQVKSEYERLSRMHLKRLLLDALDESHDFELPPTLVEQEFNAIWDQYEQEVKRQGKTVEELGAEAEESRAEYRKIAERRVRLGLVLAEVGEKNKISVTEQELNQALANRARQFPGQEKLVLEYYRRNPQAAAAELRAPIFEEKVIDFITELATVTDKPVTREELYAVAEGDDQIAHTHDHDHDHVHDENCNHDHDHDHGHGHVHDENCKHDH